MSAQTGRAAPRKVSFVNQQERLDLDFSWLRNVAGTVLAGENVAAARITVCFMTDAAIHALNRKFLDHDEPTDVITFPMSSPRAKVLEAEVAISTDTAFVAAAEKKHAPELEVALYLIHALLHLTGFNDRTANERAKMRQREGKYLAELGLRLTDYPVGIRGVQENPRRPAKATQRRRPGRMQRTKNVRPKRD